MRAAGGRARLPNRGWRRVSIQISFNAFVVKLRSTAKSCCAAAAASSGMRRMTSLDDWRNAARA